MYKRFILQKMITHPGARPIYRVVAKPKGLFAGTKYHEFGTREEAENFIQRRSSYPVVEDLDTYDEFGQKIYIW